MAAANLQQPELETAEWRLMRCKTPYRSPMTQQISGHDCRSFERAAGGWVTIPARQLVNEILQVVEPRALFLWGLRRIKIKLIS